MKNQSKYNGWKNYRKLQRDGMSLWVHKNGLKMWRKIGWKLVRQNKPTPDLFNCGKELKPLGFANNL